MGVAPSWFEMPRVEQPHLHHLARHLQLLRPSHRLGTALRVPGTRMPLRGQRAPWYTRYQIIPWRRKECTTCVRGAKYRVVGWQSTSFSAHAVLQPDISVDSKSLALEVRKSRRKDLRRRCLHV